MDHTAKIASVDRFTHRVQNYVRYRPSYPRDVIPLFEQETGLQPGSLIADVGAGTGFSARLFLEAGYEVYGVEPNAAMRSAADEYLASFPRFHSINGTAENTTLPIHSVDAVVAAQAFHWFDPPAMRAECTRILRSGGPVVLLWNTRKTDTSPFLVAYELLLKEFGTDYSKVDHTRIDETAIGGFMSSYRRFSIPNLQLFEFEGLKGRLLSSSYVPSEDDPSFMPMIERLQSIFDRHAEGGFVRFEYDTEVYIGRL